MMPSAAGGLGSLCTARKMPNDVLLMGEVQDM